MLQALVLSSDAETVRLLRRVLEQLHIECETANGAERAADLIAKRKFDAVVIDCDDTKGGPEVLKNLRHSPSNKRSMAFAIIHGTTSVREAFDLGANFVMDKPLTVERVQRSFRAAHGMMMRERRRYFRNPLASPASVITSDGRDLRAEVINLSEGGMALRIKEQVTLNSTVKLRFELPETHQRIDAKAEICWLGRQDAVGLRFLHIEQKMQRSLEQWISKMMDTNDPPGKPASVFINATARAR